VAAETKFELRGRKLGHDVFDLLFTRASCAVQPGAVAAERAAARSAMRVGARSGA
jgi:hypothetical protein